MPLPLFIGVGAAIAGVVGAGTGMHGAVKAKQANDTMKIAKNQNEKISSVLKSITRRLRSLWIS